MKKVKDLHPPFNDAVNYRATQEKDFFNKIFLSTNDIEKILSPSTFFLIGEKGSGKTAYAVYFENNIRNETVSKLHTINETQYKRFIAMKQNKKLEYSDYAAIWRPILLLLASQFILEKAKKWHHVLTGKFSEIESAVKRYNKSTLMPEIETAFELVSSDAFSATAAAKAKVAHVGEVEGRMQHQTKEAVKETSQQIKLHLLESENTLKEGLESLRLDRNYTLFIDGVDLRPEGVSYIEYINCLKGLGDAFWHLNAEFFQRTKDSKGKIKIVLLVRPDIFHEMNIYNSNSRIYDNCVLLNWGTTQDEYASSELFKLCGKFFASQQSSTDKCSDKVAWEAYFPNSDRHEVNNYAFKYFLRHSFQKPRDILTAVKILIDEYQKTGNQSDKIVNEELKKPRFSRQFSDYLLGEVRNYASFYMTPIDFSHHLKFFQFLNGKSKFTYDEFEKAYSKFKAWAKGEQINYRKYLNDSESLLQFFYDVNIIGYSEQVADSDQVYTHWSHREKTMNNFQPKVKKDGELVINKGIAKALDIEKVVTTEIKQSERKDTGKSKRYKRYHKQ